MHRIITSISCLLFCISLLSSTYGETNLEGSIDPHMKATLLEFHQIFARERFPNIVVTPKGTIVATWGTSSLKSRRSTDGGKKPGVRSLKFKSPIPKRWTDGQRRNWRRDCIHRSESSSGEDQYLH